MSLDPRIVDHLDDGKVGALVRAKPASEPIDDLRIDFEDGYGSPGDPTEDAHGPAH